MITILSGYELGIIAILVGFIVGYAVRRGAGKAQGRIFQFLALILTFFALAYAMIPIVVNEFRKDPEMGRSITDAWNQAVQNQNAGKITGEMEEEEEEYTDDAPSTRTLAEMTETQKESGKIPQEKWSQTPKTFRKTKIPSSFGFPDLLKAVAFVIIGVIILVLILLLSPIVIYLVMLFSSPFSFIFLAIALWQAWRLNRPEKRVFLGPYNDAKTIDFTKADLSRP